MAFFCIHSTIAASFGSLLGPARKTLAEKQSDPLASSEDLLNTNPQTTTSLSFKDPTQKFINYIAARLDQRSISRIQAEVKTASGHLAELILKLNLPTQPHLVISADLQSQQVLQECSTALKKIWPRAFADLPKERIEKRQSIIFDFASDYSSEAALRLLNMQFNKMISENLAGFKTARITEISFCDISCKEAEKLEALNQK